MELKGRVVVITGSAQGLGRAFANRLLQDGAKVCLSDIHEPAGEDTKKEFQTRYGVDNVHFVRCDVTKLEDLTTLYDEAEKYFEDKVDIWCNNAGINHTAGWQKCMDIDIMAVMAGTYLAMDRMNKKKGGRGGIIVNTASAAGIAFGDRDKDRADMNPYFVAKHGVMALTKSLSNPEIQEETGVTIQCICPTFTDTNIIKDGLNAAEVRSKIQKNQGGIMTPEYVAEAFHSLITCCGNGAAITVVKDNIPPFTYPDLSMPLLIILGLGAKLFGLKVFQWHHQIIFAILLCFFIHFFLGFVLNILF